MSEQRASQITMTCILTTHNILRRSKTSSGIYSSPEISDSKTKSNFSQDPA